MTFPPNQFKMVFVWVVCQLHYTCNYYKSRQYRSKYREKEILISKFSKACLKTLHNRY